MTMYETLHKLFEYRDNDLYWKVRPSNCVDMSKPAGCIEGEGYRVIKIKGKVYKAHRLIYHMFNEKWDITDTSQNNSIDHRDNDPSNNNIDNLRVATSSQNRANSGNLKNNISNAKNVYWNKERGNWRVRVRLNYKNHCGGSFVNKEDAIAKAIQMRDELHGEFANHG